MTLPTAKPISRRAFLAAAGASGAAWLLSACGVRPTPDAPPTLPPPVTLLLTPTLAAQEYPPAPSATPLPYPILRTPTATLPSIPTVSGALATPTAAAHGSVLFLPIISELRPTQVAQLAPTAAPPTAALPTAALPTAALPTAALPTAAPATATPRPTPTPIPCLTPNAPPPESAPPFVGLHASADPAIGADERCTFLDLRPSVVKVLTFHPPPDVQLLALSQPYPRWIVRAFLEFGGRAISPQQFVDFTLSDTVRTVELLAGREVWVELHNEPNLIAEGLGQAWADGAAFADWWLAVLTAFRAALPGVRFIYPGLSPGADVAGVRQSHLSFLAQSRAAVAAADALGVHVYWAAESPEPALATLDAIIARFPETPIWITEASYNKGGISDDERARQYLSFIEQLKRRPTVQGVTFFVASASNPVFAPETWVGRSLARTLGRRE